MAMVTNKDFHGNTLTVDQMLRKFKKQVVRDGIMEDLKKHEFYMPKSQRRAEKHKKHLRELEKEMRK